MSNRASILLGFSLAVGGCSTEAPPDRVSLDWQAGEVFHVGAQYRVANVRTETIPTDLEGAEPPQFDEHWTDEAFWTYQVVEEGLVPTEGDQLYPYAVKHDGSLASLSVVKSYVDPAYNDDPELLEADPVVYLVFREDRDRLAAIVSFTNVDGERVERAWSSEELGKSWSALSQSMLTAAPTYLAPFAAGWGDDSKTLENGSVLDTVAVDDGVVDVYYDDELGGGLVMNRYESGKPWPTVTATDNVEARLLTEADLAARRAELPPLLPTEHEDFDYRAALASTVDIERALVLDDETVAGGWDASVDPAYQPWAGSWWPLTEAAHVFGYRSGFDDDTLSDLAKSDLQPLKSELEQLNDEIRDMSDGPERTEKVEEYRTRQSAYVDEIVDFYGGLLQGLEGGTITIADGTIAGELDGESFSFSLDELSPYDKHAVHLYLEGQTNPNPFYISAWTLLNQWAAWSGGDNSWWGYCNGWAAAAILEDEPREPVTVTAGDQQITYGVGDLKGLTSAMHYSTNSRFYGSRYYGEGDDLSDLSPKAFHTLIQFYFREQGVPLVFDTTAEAQVWNFPAYAAFLEVDETTDPDLADRININTAGAEELETLHGIGEVKAQRIIEYRYSWGPFQAIEDIQEVSGIGPATFEDIQGDITVDPYQRTFDVCAYVDFTTDAVAEDHVDSASGPEGFSETYCYSLTTDSAGQVVDGTWRDVRHHPDFAWVPYDNPLSSPSGGSENPYLHYGTYLRSVVDLRRQ